MKNILLLIFVLLPILCEVSSLHAETTTAIANLQKDNENSMVNKLDSEIKSFKPFDCKKLDTEYLRINERNDCLIIQELSNEYLIKPQKIDPNTWNKPLLLRYLDNHKDGKILAHTWNNIVEWGGNSNKQPISHLVVLEMPNLLNLFNGDPKQLSSEHITLPLTARRIHTIDVDKDGNKEIVYLSNREDGRNRKNNWKDFNYIFDLNKKQLKQFGSSHFSHDLMSFDFNQDGYVEIIDYFYGEGKPSGIEVCDLENEKCWLSEEIGEFVDIGFNHIFSSKNGAIIFGGCPGLGDTSFCWSNISFNNEQIKLTKIDQYDLKPKPKAKAKFKIWTGDINNKPGYWIEGSDKKEFKMADRAWMSASLDFNGDGFIDSMAIEKEVFCKRRKAAEPFDRSGGDCNDMASLYIFKNLDDERFEKHQVLETSINDDFRIEKADINKDGTMDLYGLVQGYYNPWMACNYTQLKSIYLNINNKLFEKASENFVETNFGMYGCERASSFFNKENKYYRLFISTPSPESKTAYLGIENYTQN